MSPGSRLSLPLPLLPIFFRSGFSVSIFIVPGFSSLSFFRLFFFVVSNNSAGNLFPVCIYYRHHVQQTCYRTTSQLHNYTTFAAGAASILHAASGPHGEQVARRILPTSFDRAPSPVSSPVPWLSHVRAVTYLHFHIATRAWQWHRRPIVYISHSACPPHRSLRRAWPTYYWPCTLFS